ncbi:MAG: DUF4411 family protein [Methanobrevibacter sp.]|jgi:hypothetical protein|nr:DUF4411 family protein [Candidatus Methanoflexus mossambicus]
MYVLDTNVLLSLQNHYFADVFVGLWIEINSLIEDNMLISIKEVQREVTSKEHKQFWDKINENHDYKFYKELDNGEIEEWFKIEELDIYHKIIIRNKKDKNEEWSLQKEWSQGEAIADPLLICHGLKHNSTVVTTESPKKQYNIPHVCKKLSINCIGIREFFKENNLKF